MDREDYDELDFTLYAAESMYDIVDDAYFRDQDSFLIYHALRHRLKAIPFGDYLKRYIYQKAELTGGYSQIPLKEYQQIIRDAFSDNMTPSAFSPATTKMSALTKNWLTQQTVNRKVVFLLGFGLGMSTADVNAFLTKGLREPEINVKDPFEVICWYCYQHRYSFPKYEKLWDMYQSMAANSLDLRMIYEDRTMDMRGRMHTIQDDAALLAYVTRLKTEDNISRFSATARKYFDRLYDEARDLIAALYNARSESNHHYVREEITAGDMERMICSAIPVDAFGNLTPGRDSSLNQQFLGRRFSRSRIHRILAGNMEIDRFDLITLQFFVYCLKVDDFPKPKQRYLHFIDTTNQMLENCCMGSLYIANPYECFILMCILSDDPLGTYADVWELSYASPDQEEELLDI